MMVGSVNIPASASLKMAVPRKETRPVSVIPSTGTLNASSGVSGRGVKLDGESVRSVNDMVAYLQLANKSIKSIQSILSEMKVSANRIRSSDNADVDAHARSAKDRLGEIRDIIKNSKLGSENVFSVNYMEHGLKFNPKALVVNNVDPSKIDSIEGLEELFKQASSDINRSLSTLHTRLESTTRNKLIPEDMMEEIVNGDASAINKLNKKEFSGAHSEVDAQRVSELLA